MEQAQVQLAFPGGKRLYLYLKDRYFWSHMQQDIVSWCADSMPNQAESHKWKPPPFLMPSRKTVGPFHTWCLDTCPRLSPPT